MRDDELLDLVNWYSSEIGSKEVRPGLTPFLDQVDNSPVVASFYAKFPNGQKRLLRFSGKKVYAVDPTVATGWGAAIFSNVTDFVKPEAVILNGKLHIVDQNSAGVGQYFEYDSSTMTEVNTTSAGDLVMPYKGKSITILHRRVYVGSPYYAPNTYRSRLAWSTIDYQNAGTDPASPWTTQADDVSSANFRDIDIDYKGGITKITNINDRINVYKEEGIYRYNESQVFSLFGLSPFPSSVATMEETQEDYFLTNEGFFKTDGASKPTPIAEGWYPIIKQILKNGIDRSKIVSFSANYWYFCYLGNVTYDGEQKLNACFVYDAKLDEMWLWKFAFDISSIGHFVNDNGEKVILLGDINGNMYKLDTNANDDAGNAIMAYFKHKYVPFNDPSLLNRMMGLYAFGTPGVELELGVALDFKDEWPQIASVNGFILSTMVDFERIGHFQFLSTKISWNGKGKRPKFNGFIAEILPVTEDLQ